MRILDRSVYVGPSLYAHFPVIRLELDLGPLEDWPTARLGEAYPVDKPGRASDDAMWFGANSMYDRAGFEEVARRKPERPIVRLAVTISAVEWSSPAVSAA